VTQYHKYLAENSLIKSVSDPDVLPPAPKDNGAPSARSEWRDRAKRQQD